MNSLASITLRTSTRKYIVTAMAAAVLVFTAMQTRAGAGSSTVVRNLQSGQCLYPTSPAQGAPIHQAPCDGFDSRSFGVEYVNMQGREVPVQKAMFRLRNVQTNMCLDLASASNGNGVPIVQNPCSGTLTQQWSRQGPLGLVNYYQLVNRSNGKCLDAAMNASHVQQWQCGNGNNQSWWATY